MFLRSGQIILTKRDFEGWRQIQDHYQDYMASLGPWDKEGMLDFLRTEYSWFGPKEAERVLGFIDAGDVEMIVKGAS